MINDIATIAQIIPKAHNKCISSCAISLNNCLLVTGSLEGAVKVWKRDKKDPLYHEDTKISPLKPRHKYGVTAIKFSPADTFFATASIDGHVFLYNSVNCKLLTVFTQTSNKAVRSLCFSPNCTLLVTGDDHGTICAWKLYDQSLIKTITDHDGSINATVFSHDSRILVTCCSFGLLNVWQTLSLSLEHFSFVEQAHDLGINSAEFQNKSSDKYLLATAGNDNLITVWKICEKNRKIEKLWSLKHHKSAVICLCFNNVNLLTSAGLDNIIAFWDFEKSPAILISELKPHTQYVSCLNFSKDSKLLISGSNDNSLIIWNMKTEKESNFSYNYEELSRTKLYEKNIETIIENKSNNVQLIQILQNDSITNSLNLFKNDILIIAIRNHFKQYTFIKETSTFRPIDLDSFNFKNSTLLQSNIKYFQFTNSYNYLINVLDNGDLNIVDRQLGGGVRNIENVGNIRISTSSLNENYLITVDEQEIISVWETSTLKKLTSIQENYSTITCISMTIDNSIIAYGTFNGYLIILMWENSTLSIGFEECQTHDLGVTCCNFNSVPIQSTQMWSSTGYKYLLVSSGMDGVIKLWRVQEHQKRRIELILWHTFEGHKYGVEKVEFVKSNNDFFISSSSNDKQVRIWSLLNPISSLYILEHNCLVIDSCLAANSQTLVTSCIDKSIWIWSLDKCTFKKSKTNTEPIPDRYLCPISKEIMQIPVCCSDGFTYDQSSITNWFQLGHRTSPMTNSILNDLETIEDHNLCTDILTFLNANK